MDNELKISIIGTGYVGLVTGVCLADLGRKVICVDSNTKKISSLINGNIPIYEPGLEELINQNKDRLTFTTDIKYAVESSNLVFIAVGTPMGEDGSADLQYVLNVASSIGKYMNKDLFIIDKSTVPVGTADLVKAAIKKELDTRKVKFNFEVISNPEFLKEGSAINDFSRPDRVVIGYESEQAKKVMYDLYYPLVRNDESKLIFMDVRSAEMTKYAANALLATKISFMNEIANICELVGANVNNVRLGIGSDTRIGTKFLYAGCGYGGSCFPKDVKALIKTSEDNGYLPRILNATEEVNNKQKLVIFNKIIKRFGKDLTGLTFTIWGLAFKPNTDDMREAPSIYIIKELLEAGATVNVYDPKAMEEAKSCYLKDLPVNYFNNKYDCLNNSNALILLTEWKEFQLPDFTEMLMRLSNNIIFDGRNQYSKLDMSKFEYYQIGVKNE